MRIAPLFVFPIKEGCCCKPMSNFILFSNQLMMMMMMMMNQRWRVTDSKHCPPPSGISVQRVYGQYSWEKIPYNTISAEKRG